jgi:hypothetical protein
MKFKRGMCIIERKHASKNPARTNSDVLIEFDLVDIGILSDGTINTQGFIDNKYIFFLILDCLLLLLAQCRNLPMPTPVTKTSSSKRETKSFQPDRKTSKHETFVRPKQDTTFQQKTDSYVTHRTDTTRPLAKQPSHQIQPRLASPATTTTISRRTASRC